MKKIILTFFIASFLLMGITAYSQEPTPRPLKPVIHSKNPTKSIDNKSNNEKTDANNSASFNKKPTAPNDHQATYDNAHNQDDKTTTDRGVMWATFAIAFFALCQVGAMIFQYFAMHKQAETFQQSVTITKDIAGANERSANATLAAAHAAKRSAESLPLVERAYVFVKIGSTAKRDIQDTVGVGSVTYSAKNMIAVFENYGRTPAIIREIRMYTGSRTFNEPGEIIENQIPIDIPNGTIISNRKEVEEFPVRLTLEEWTDINSFKIPFFCWGHVKYEDIFKRPQNTNFCWQWSPYKQCFVIADKKELNDYT